MEELQAHRKLGAAHKQTREWIQENMQSYTTDLDLARAVERHVLTLGYRPAFPCMVSVDDCVAHWTPPRNPKEARPIQLQRLLKIDFGLLDPLGRIADAAFSYSTDPTNLELINVSEEAAALAIGMAGPDAFISDIGAAIQECIESNEIDGKAVHSVWDLCGHSIERFKVHGHKAVPNIAFELPPSMRRMKEGKSTRSSLTLRSARPAMSSTRTMRTNSSSSSTGNTTSHTYRRRIASTRRCRFAVAGERPSRLQSCTIPCRLHTLRALPHTQNTMFTSVQSEPSY